MDPPCPSSCGPQRTGRLLGRNHHRSPSRMSSSSQSSPNRSELGSSTGPARNGPVDEPIGTKAKGRERIEAPFFFFSLVVLLLLRFGGNLKILSRGVRKGQYCPRICVDGGFRRLAMQGGSVIWSKGGCVVSLRMGFGCALCWPQKDWSCICCVFHGGFVVDPYVMVRNLDLVIGSGMIWHPVVRVSWIIIRFTLIWIPILSPFPTIWAFAHCLRFALLYVYQFWSHS